MQNTDTLLGPIPNADHREVGNVLVDTVKAGAARVKRVVYPIGFRWTRDLQAIIGTPLCMHAHVGFLAHGRLGIGYANGDIEEFTAPQVVAIEPGHDGWVIGEEPAVLIQFDFETDTIERLGLPKVHEHQANSPQTGA